MRLPPVDRNGRALTPDGRRLYSLSPVLASRRGRVKTHNGLARREDVGQIWCLPRLVARTTTIVMETHGDAGQVLGRSEYEQTTEHD